MDSYRNFFAANVQYADQVNYLIQYHDRRNGPFAAFDDAKNAATLTSDFFVMFPYTLVSKDTFEPVLELAGQHFKQREFIEYSTRHILIGGFTNQGKRTYGITEDISNRTNSSIPTKQLALCVDMGKDIVRKTGKPVIILPTQRLQYAELVLFDQESYEKDIDHKRMPEFVREYPLDLGVRESGWQAKGLLRIIANNSQLAQVEFALELGKC